MHAMSRKPDHVPSEMLSRGPLNVSLIAPAYNEAQILNLNLQSLYDYMSRMDRPVRWELIVVNDGSSDATAEVADKFAASHTAVRVLHHPRNFGLGRALRSGFSAASGDLVICVDVDLTYAPEYIEALIAASEQSHADVVLLSPYMQDGRVSHVPFLRRLFSLSANRFLCLAGGRRLHTSTGMVRLYSRSLLSQLCLNSDGMEINLEILHKALLLGARVKEIPAHLNWEHCSGGEDRRARLSPKVLFRQFCLVLHYSLLFMRARRKMLQGVVK